SGLLRHMWSREGAQEDTVAEAIEHDYVLVQPHTPLAALEPVFERGGVALVQEGEDGPLVGLVTKIDLLHFLMHRNR
ncbi:MAG: CBS domain-containing protein, partial [Planctomycetota bacterium]